MNNSRFLFTSLIAFALATLSSFGQSRQISFSWPETQKPSNVATASFPVASIPWIERFETNIDKLQSGPYDLVFDGDSITDNWQSAGATVWQQNYGSIKAMDIGIGGDMVEHLLWRVQNGSLAGQDPKLIVVMAGTNNIGQTPADVVAGIQLLLNEYETRCPHAHILLLAIFPRGFTPTDGGRIWVNQVDAILATTNFGNRVTYIDFGSQFLQPDGTITTDMMADGLHPSAQGYTIWANAIQPYVAQYVFNAATYGYSLAVNGGTGSGSYAAGSVVTVTAGAPASGSQFAGWTGDISGLANPSAATTTLTMSALATSITATYTTAPTAPSVPTGLVATNGIAQVNLEWTASAGATSYKIYRGTSAGGENATAIATGITSANYSDTSMTDGTTYYYTVAAVNSLGTSASSTESSAAAILFPSRQISFAWPQPQQPSNVAWASFPVPRIDWVADFELNVDKLQSGPYDLIFDGDSITAGWTSSVWQQYYGSMKAVQIGISGDQVQNLTWRAQNGSLAGQNPKLIVLEIGSNNYNQTPSDVAAGIQLLIGQYKTLCPYSHILLLGIFPRNASPTDPVRTWISQVNQILSTYGDSTVTYMDIGSQFLQPDGTLTTDIMPDGMNPSAQGYTIWANAIQSVVNQYVSGIVTAPSTPTGLTATAGNTQVTLSWTSASGATSYNIYRSTTAGGEGTIAIATGISTTSYIDSNLTNGQTYYYEVAAVSASGTSGMSTETSATPNVVASTLITWGTAQKMVGNTDVSTAGSPFDAATFNRSAQTVNGVTFNPMVVSGTVNGLTGYSDGIISANSPGNTPAAWGGNFSSTSPSSAAYSAAVSSLAFGYFANGTVNITSLTIGHSYQVQVWSFYPSANGNCNTTLTGANTVTLVPDAGQYAIGTFTAASATQTFNYNYGASDGMINGISIRDITSGGGTLLAPTGLTATAGNAQVGLTWTASTGATSYNVYRGTTAGGENTTAIATGISATSYTDTGLINGTTYYYKVAAVNTSGASGLSTEANAVPLLPGAPLAPTNLTVITGNTQASLSWTASTGATSYSIYRGTSPGGEGATAIATGVTSTSYTDTGLTNGTTYYYKVVAVNSSGSSGYSTEVGGTSGSNLVLAVGLERIVSGYSGPAIRIQRVTDNTQQDIGFASGSNLLNTASVSAFLGSQGQGWVVTLYSQDGSGHNLTAPSGTDNMPTISMTAPTTMSINGTTVLTARTDTNLRYFILPSSVSVNKAQMSAFLAFRPDYSGGQGEPLFEIGNATTDAADLQITGTGLQGLSHNSVTQLGGGFSGTPGTWFPSIYPRTQPTVVGLVTTPGSLATIYLDGVAHATGGTASSAVTCTGGYLMTGSSTGGLRSASYNFLAFALYNGTVDASTAASISNTMLPRTVPTINLVGDGDSITQGTGDIYGFNALRYAETQFTMPVDLTNIAIYGTRTYDTLSKVSNLTIPTSGVGLLYNPSYAKNIYYLAIGTNDLHEASTGTDTWSRAQQCLQNAKSLGYKTVIATVLHEYTETSTESAEVNNFNTLARAAVGQSYLDAVIDYAADPRIGIAVNFYPTYTADGTHPNDLGYQVMGSIAAPVLNQLIGVTTYSQWSSTYFTAQQLADPTVSGPAAIPQNDGISNLLKYLFDINPSAAMSATDRAALPAVGMTTVSGSSYLTLTYRQNAAETGLTINVQTSTDMNTWTTVTPDNTVNVGTDPVTNDPLIQVQVKVPAGTPQEFIRLNVTGS